MLLDGRAGLTKKGWEEEIKAAKHLVASLEVSSGKAETAIFMYSGPRTWSGVEKCTGKNAKTVENSEETCGMKTISHFTNDYKKLYEKLTNLEWPKGGALTSLALLKAKAERRLHNLRDLDKLRSMLSEEDESSVSITVLSETIRRAEELPDGLELVQAAKKLFSRLETQKKLQDAMQTFEQKRIKAALKFAVEAKVDQKVVNEAERLVLRLDLMHGIKEACKGNDIAKLRELLDQAEARAEEGYPLRP